MAKVTVCIPAYRAETFVADTVANALSQSFRDIEVAVAIEPPGDGELHACERFRGDDRLRLTINKTRLGWAENIAAMLARVNSPFFVVLPHDDFMHRRYIEILLGELEAHAEAICAYGDIQFMGGGSLQRRRQVLSEGDVGERLMSFLAEGAEAPPWRGVTRSSILQSCEFPTDQFRGLLVECEWAFQLLAHGVARRAPQTLYFKRLFASERETASGARWQVPAEVIRAGLEDHRLRLLRIADRALPQKPPLLAPAVEAVVARRYVQFGVSADDPDLRSRIYVAAVACVDERAPYARRVFANLLLLQSWLSSAAGDQEGALVCVRSALEADQGNAEAYLQLARLMRAKGDRFSALEAISMACDVSPYVAEANALAAQIEAEFLASLSTE